MRQFNLRVNTMNAPEHIKALQSLLLATSKLRLRVKQFAPALTQFSEWTETTDAMRQAEQVIKSQGN